MKQKIKSTAWLLVRIGVTFGILWFVFHKMDFRRLGEILREARWPFLCPALFFVLMTLLLTALRWRLLLRVQGIDFTTFQAFAITYIGNFFNCFMPGGTGGDLVKVVYAMQAAPDKKSGAFMTIVVDRIVGMCGLFVILIPAVAINARQLYGDRVIRPYFLLEVLLIVGVIGVVVLGMWKNLPRHVPLVGRILERLPLRDKLAQLMAAYHAYAGHPRVVVWTVLMSVGVHSSLVGILYFSALALVPQGVSLWYFFLAVPFIILLAAIPITFSGLGVREKLFTVMLASRGISDEASVALSLLGFALTVLGNLPGGLVYLFYKNKHPVKGFKPEDGSQAGSGEKD